VVALRAALACYAANIHMDGDPVWLGLVAGSSTGKTETAYALTRCPSTIMASTLSGEAALLSGTAEKDRTAGATGGLLRQVGEHGMLVLKDFTTVLSMHPDKRGQILSALREIYDGYWYRDVGTGGGTRLEWRGKLGMLMCSTTAYDRAHAVIALMGDRFLLVRLDDDKREAGALAALRGAGSEREARAAIADAAAGLLAGKPDHPPLAADADEEQDLARLADFVTMARSPVDRDYQGEIALVLDPEGPYRFVKELAGLWPRLRAARTRPRRRLGGRAAGRPRLPAPAALEGPAGARQSRRAVHQHRRPGRQAPRQVDEAGPGGPDRPWRRRAPLHRPGGGGDQIHVEPRRAVPASRESAG
jgi:hypothetical protein